MISMSVSLVLYKKLCCSGIVARFYCSRAPKSWRRPSHAQFEKALLNNGTCAQERISNHHIAMHRTFYFLLPIGALNPADVIVEQAVYMQCIFPSACNICICYALVRLVNCRQGRL